MGNLIIQELELFLESAYYGMLLGLSYDVLRIVRRVIRHRNIIVYIQDYLFWVVWGIIIFAMIFTENNGDIRAYVFGGIVIGDMLYLKTFSRPIVRYISRIINFIVNLLLKKPMKKIRMFLTRLMWRLKKTLLKGTGKNNGKLKNKRKERKRSDKKGKTKAHTD